MKNFRIIPRLEIKSNNLVKGMRMEGLKKIGDPSEFSKDYYNQFADEIFYEDIVASLYNRKLNIELIKKISSNIQIPLTVSGRIRNIKDMYEIFNCGGDKVSVNTHALKNPKLLKEASNLFGSQSICAHIQYKKTGVSTYEVFSESGRQRHYIDLFEWLRLVQDMGVGELYLFSIDNDGVNTELDYHLLERVRKICNVPLLYGGGIREKSEIDKLVNLNFDGVCISHALHNKKISILSIKKKFQKTMSKYIYK
tara:strand:- start:237 stop:995 length:759 start_codon:yes stop_codon:yes gene_type:complete